MHQDQEILQNSYDDYGYVTKIKKCETMFPITMISFHDFDLSQMFGIERCCRSTFVIWKKREKKNCAEPISEDAFDDCLDLCGNVISDTLYNKIREL